MAYSALGGHSTLRGDGARGEPLATEPLLREFLSLLEAIQEELNQRWNGQGELGCHADRV
ncbi:hypothetical protein ACFY30_16500 [Streptomyces sp. NPDC000345]|uniref:hypothetical protein n=1 Tax=unclassified Streptomyces TaxID=2593676 RepID=UPI0036BE761A